MKRIISSVLAAALSVLLCSCSDTLTFTYDKGKLIDEKNAVTYVGAPLNLEPIGTLPDMYARCNNIELYVIDGADPMLWLSEKYNGIGTVYYAEGAVTPPDIAEFDANALVVCKEETTTVGIAHIDDQADVDAIIEAFQNGEDAQRDTDAKRYKLKFSSDKYKGLYYALEYYETDDGEKLIFDRNTGVCKNVGDVLIKYMPS